MLSLRPSAVVEIAMVLTVATARIVGLLTGAPAPLGLVHEYGFTGQGVAMSVGLLALVALAVAAVSPRSRAAHVVKVLALAGFLVVMTFTETAFLVVWVTLFLGAVILLSPVGLAAALLLLVVGVPILVVWAGRRPIGPIDPVASQRRAWEPDPAGSWLHVADERQASAEARLLSAAGGTGSACSR